MVAIGDVLGIKQFFSVAGNQALMISFWEIMAIVGDPVSIDEFTRDFHQQFGETILTTFLWSGATYDRTVCENIDGSMDFGDYSDVINGTNAGEPAPSFVALDVKQNVSNRITRGGRKRLPFITEGMFEGNAETLAGVAQLAIESFFGGPTDIFQYLDETMTNFVSIRPVIVGRVESPPDSGIYVLDPSRVNPVASANLVRVTSQVSRKV